MQIARQKEEEIEEKGEKERDGIIQMPLRARVSQLKARRQKLYPGLPICVAGIQVHEPSSFSFPGHISRKLGGRWNSVDLTWYSDMRYRSP